MNEALRELLEISQDIKISIKNGEYFIIVMMDDYWFYKTGLDLSICFHECLQQAKGE